MRTPAKNSHSVARHNVDQAQLSLVHEDELEVARSLVAALGGAKVVGPKLFPQRSPEAAARALLDILNPNRDHNLTAEQFLTLLRWAREKGIHFGMHWICDELHYGHPQSIEPEDVAADILCRVDDVRDELTGLLKQLDRLPRGRR